MSTNSPPFRYSASPVNSSTSGHFNDRRAQAARSANRSTIARACATAHSAASGLAPVQAPDAASSPRATRRPAWVDPARSDRAPRATFRVSRRPATVPCEARRAEHRTGRRGAANPRVQTDPACSATTAPSRFSSVARPSAPTTDCLTSPERHRRSGSCLLALQRRGVDAQRIGRIIRQQTAFKQRKLASARPSERADGQSRRCVADSATRHSRPRRATPRSSLDRIAARAAAPWVGHSSWQQRSHAIDRVPRTRNAAIVRAPAASDRDSDRARHAATKSAVAGRRSRSTVQSSSEPSSAKPSMRSAPLRTAAAHSKAAGASAGGGLSASFNNP